MDLRAVESLGDILRDGEASRRNSQGYPGICATIGAWLGSGG